MAIFATTHLCEFLDLEDVQEMLEGQEFKLLPKLFPKKLFTEEHHTDSLSAGTHQCP